MTKTLRLALRVKSSPGTRIARYYYFRLADRFARRGISGTPSIPIVSLLAMNLLTIVGVTSHVLPAITTGPKWVFAIAAMGVLWKADSYLERLSLEDLRDEFRSSRPLSSSERIAAVSYPAITLVCAGLVAVPL